MQRGWARSAMNEASIWVTSCKTVSVAEHVSRPLVGRHQLLVADRPCIETLGLPSRVSTLRLDPGPLCTVL